MSDYEMHNGDMLEVLPTLAKGSVSMVFADLPYATRLRSMTDCDWDTPANIYQFWNVVQSLEGQPLFVLTATQPFASELIYANKTQFRYDIIWDKIRPSAHLNAKRAPLRRHEHVLVFSAKAVNYAPIMVSGKPYKSGFNKPAKAFIKRQKMNKGSKIISDGKRYPTSILPIDKQCRVRGLHPTQKPVALLEWLIATYTNPGDTVLDPCFGSGTTGVACANLGRKFIGIEKDATYFAAGKTRIEKAYAEAAAGHRQTSLAI